ncbi:MAG: hypothetical protein V3W28_03655 [Thermoplasmata archaeon]
MAEIDLPGLLREVLRLEGEKDSFEVGPAGSRLKIYGSFDDEAAFAKKIDRALSLRAHALEKLAEQEGGP